MKILQLIKANQTISALDMAKNIGISQRKIQDNIKKLKEKGVIVRIGPPKGGFWKVKNSIE